MRTLLATAALCLPLACALAQAPPKPGFDAELAKSVGADEYGMRGYVLAILKTGPNPMPAGKERDEMFKGHFANINRLAAEGKLALAGPFDGVGGWRGLFILAVTDIEEARRLTATDPVVSSGEMVVEYHKYYGSAALMLVNEGHNKVAKELLTPEGSKMIQGACLCGSVRWQFDGQPDGATACNCTACRRYGVLWAYDFEDVGIHVSGPTQAYVRGKALEFHFCPTCGCVTHWRGLRLDEQGRRRIAVNLRLAEPEAVAHIPIDHFDGLVSFDDLPRDGRCVADYWF